MLTRTILATCFAATLALGAAQTSTARDVIIVREAPPPPRVEVVPAPRRGYEWAPGYWNWQGNRHVWVKGHYVKARHGYSYRPHEWVERDGRWQLHRGRWDRDGDGIPDRRDAHPNNPNRP